MTYYDDMWPLVGVIALTIAVTCGLILFFAPKKVDGYYLSRGAGMGNVCVYAHWTWHPDELAFCTDDYQKALDFVKQANSSIK